LRSVGNSQEGGIMTNKPEAATVIVGVNETGNSRTAIRLAAEEARYRKAALIAVMAYSRNPALGAPASRPVATSHTSDDGRIFAESALRAAVVDALGDQADRVEQRTVPGPAGRNLIDTARTVNARLLVLASRGGTSTLPGTVSQYVLRRAPCPVLVVPQAAQA
jgi:nucleotide-binding universal stress UspA family protein